MIDLHGFTKISSRNVVLGVRPYFSLAYVSHTAIGGALPHVFTASDPLLSTIELKVAGISAGIMKSLAADVCAANDEKAAEAGGSGAASHRGGDAEEPP